MDERLIHLLLQNQRIIIEQLNSIVEYIEIRDENIGIEEQEMIMITGGDVDET